MAVAVLSACASVSPTPALDLPARPATALTASELVPLLRELDLDARERRIVDEIVAGNVPDWLRTLRPVQLGGEREGRTYAATIWVTPDYLAVGSDRDYLLVPLTPVAAQRIADRVQAFLPTSRIVDAVWEQAELRLGPDSIAPSPAMTTVPVFEDHARLVGMRRERASAPLGALVAGHKKDVVITALLAGAPGRVAIYGWHRPDGRPIQPLYIGHTMDYADYSHGVRLVSRRVVVDGVVRDLGDVLGDERLAWLVSEEGVISEPRYSPRR